MGARRLLPMLGLVVAGFWVPSFAVAQGNVRISLEPSIVVFPTPGVPEFDAGWVDYGAMVVAIRSRPPQAGWELRIRASGPGMGQSKAVSDILWRVAGSSVWTPLQATEAVVLQGSGDREVTVELRVLLDWTSDGPGAYSTGLDFTVVRL